MAPDKAIKHPKLLKQPTFFETFFKKPSTQYQSFCLKSSFLLVSGKKLSIKQSEAALGTSVHGFKDQLEFK